MIDCNYGSPWTSFILDVVPSNIIETKSLSQECFVEPSRIKQILVIKMGTISECTREVKVDELAQLT